MTQPFAGIRVLEVGGSIALAAATKSLSDFGADVIKLEPIGRSELRRTPPFLDDRPDVNGGAYHLALDTGKRSVTLDAATPSGRSVVLRLAREAHAVFMHLAPSVARPLLDGIRRIPGADRPAVVTMSAHGLDGPYAEYLENDMSLLARSSRMRHHGGDASEPLRYAPHVPTIQWGATAAAAGAAALWERERGGRAIEVDAAGVEALAGNVDAWFIIWNFSGVEMPRPTARSTALYPAGCYECADGYVVFAASNDPFFTRLCEGIGQPELAKDPRFSAPEARAAHFDEFMAHLGPWLQQRTRQQVFAELQSHGVMVAPMLNVAEALQDEQARARGSFVTVAGEASPTVTIAGPPFRMADAWEARPAPPLGADTNAVLSEHGYGRDEQIALFRAGVI